MIACALLLPSGTLYGQDVRMTDLEKATAQAEKENKNLFIIYKGSAWNPDAYGVPERLLASDLFKKAA